jgi:hypothetical protein
VTDDDAREPYKAATYTDDLFDAVDESKER